VRGDPRALVAGRPPAPQRAGLSTSAVASADDSRWRDSKFGEPVISARVFATGHRDKPLLSRITARASREDASFGGICRNVEEHLHLDAMCYCSGAFKGTRLGRDRVQYRGFSPPNKLEAVMDAREADLSELLTIFRRLSGELSDLSQLIQKATTMAVASSSESEKAELQQHDNRLRAELQRLTKLLNAPN
jgi:hypothetical protein